MTTEYPSENPSTLASSLSFGRGSASTDADDSPASVVHLEPAALQSDLPEAGDEKNAAAAADDSSSDDFEFAFVVRDSEAFPSATADEIFSDGRILPAYPVFDRDLLLLPHSDAEERKLAAETPDVAEKIPLGRLLLEEKEASSGSSSEAPETAGEYCAWVPADRCKKSASTGSSLRWRLRDLMVGRSHSDGKEKFVFLEAAPPAKEKTANAGPNAAKTAAPGKGAKKPVRVAEMDVVTAHRLFYGKGTSDKAVKGPRRSFLPYRQELFGLFAPANSLHRTHHPL
ncbi:hypothetical protein Cni_G11638 [Canna indica]|uniref:Uncharacterized protein n=1 Tax=Canna indica TaxID=4628 RepID=A0AAQ3K702_9LILI|nr:hypothetical protein Cni_G11638 [Canna indica]